MNDERLIRVLKALADEKRFRMVREIAAAGELSCGQIGERFQLSQPTISHHLKILAEAGVLTTRQDAQHHYISVNQPLLDEVSAELPSRVALKPAALNPAVSKAVKQIAKPGFVEKRARPEAG